MTESLKKTTKEELLKMPKEWQEAVNDFNWEKISEEIGKKYSLLDSEVNNLQVEIMLTLTGIEQITELEVNILYNVVLVEEKAKKISEEIIEKIFTPIANKVEEIIKDSLKNKNIHWKQNLDFILSGGDYTAFIKRVEEEKMSPDILKKNFNPSKIDDLKSSFTI